MTSAIENNDQQRFISHFLSSTLKRAQRSHKWNKNATFVRASPSVFNLLRIKREKEQWKTGFMKSPFSSWREGALILAK